MRQFDKGSLGTVGSLLWTNIESGETSEGITFTRVMTGCIVRNRQKYMGARTRIEDFSAIPRPGALLQELTRDPPLIHPCCHLCRSSFSRCQRRRSRR